MFHRLYDIASYADREESHAGTGEMAQKYDGLTSHTEPELGSQHPH